MLEASAQFFVFREIMFKKLVSIFLFSYVFLSAQNPNNQIIQRLLPEHDSCIVEYQKLPGGLSNDITLYKTSLGNAYIFRQAKKLDDKGHFNNIVALAKKAALLHMAPEIYGADDGRQCMLMAYIENVPWPSFEDNEQPYRAAMVLLRAFHDAMRADALKDKPTEFEPFVSNIKKTEHLLTRPNMPQHVQLACHRMKTMYEYTKSWLEKQATLYEGDCKKGNVLLEQRESELHPWLIDFDSMNIGHPYFDVVKFSFRLPPEQRLLLFEMYLDRQPTQEERVHFAILDSALRLLIALIRFDVALTVHAFDESPELLTKKQMEELLDSPQALPSQSTILLRDPDPKIQQLAALYALHDFLRCSENCINANSA